MHAEFGRFSEKFSNFRITKVFRQTCLLLSNALFLDWLRSFVNKINNPPRGKRTGPGTGRQRFLGECILTFTRTRVSAILGTRPSQSISPQRQWWTTVRVINLCRSIHFPFVRPVLCSKRPCEKCAWKNGRRKIVFSTTHTINVILCFPARVEFRIYAQNEFRQTTTTTIVVAYFCLLLQFFLEKSAEHYKTVLRCETSSQTVVAQTPFAYTQSLWKDN